MKDPSQYFIHGNSSAAADDGMALHIMVCPAYGADWSVVYVHSNEIKRLRAALEKIAAIENKEWGPDWEEIDEARTIAGKALRREALDELTAQAHELDMGY